MIVDFDRGRLSQATAVPYFAGWARVGQQYALVCSKAELDQFCEGLKECGVLEAIREHPAALEQYFFHMPMELSAGET